MKAKIFFLISPLVIAACHSATFTAPDLTDNPKIATAQLGTISDEAPTYGIAVDSRTFEVSTEAEDGPYIRVGQDAEVYVDDQKEPIAGKVVRKIMDASVETGQSLVWLKAGANVSVHPGEFVQAVLKIKTKQNALIVPRSAIYVKEGAQWAIVANESKFVPVKVQVGIMSSDSAEVTSGLKAGDKVVYANGIGYLYPDFKANADD